MLDFSNIAAISLRFYPQISTVLTQKDVFMDREDALWIMENYLPPMKKKGFDTDI